MRVCGDQKAPLAIVEDDTRADIFAPRRPWSIGHRTWPLGTAMAAPHREQTSLAHAVLAASPGLDYNRPLNKLDAEACHRTDAHGYGVSVSQIAVMVARVARAVRDRRMTISRTLLMSSRHTLLTPYADADVRRRSSCPHRRRMRRVPNTRGHTSAQLIRVAAILTTRLHPDRHGGTGTAADRSDVES
jgi:hypothetical protein